MESYNSLDEDSNKECMKNLDDATKEWDEVQEIVPAFAHEMRNSNNINGIPPSVKTTPLVSVAQVLNDFRNQDLTAQRAEAEVSLRVLFQNFIKLIFCKVK